MAKGKREESIDDADDDVTIIELVNGKSKKHKKKKSKKVKKEGESISRCSFPMSRVKRIIKSEGSSIHISQDSVFLINKASEKFLELFCKEAFACANKKKQIEYKHLSSVVSKRKRFDFLSDFVPEKVKAGVALAEISSAKT